MSIRSREQTINQWWESRRPRYNIGLLISGALAFTLYATLGSAWGDSDFEITIFTTIFQGVAYLFMIGIANIFYFLGPYVDKRMNKSDNGHFRRRLFNLGFWFSCSLPFLIPMLLFVSYLLK
jgi:hypothetical protein